MRIFADIVLLLALYLAPWWLTLLAAAIFSFFFRNYVELLLAGFIIDEVWGEPGRFPFDFKFVAFALSIIVFLISEFLRKRLSWYSNL